MLRTAPGVTARWARAGTAGASSASATVAPVRLCMRRRTSILVPGRAAKPSEEDQDEHGRDDWSPPAAQAERAQFPGARGDTHRGVKDLAFDDREQIDRQVREHLWTSVRLEPDPARLH